MSGAVFHVEPKFAHDRKGRWSAAVIVCLANGGAALTIDQSRDLRAALEAAEKALAETLTVAAKDLARLAADAQLREP